VSEIIHADETDINIGAKRHWLHGASNDSWTCYELHERRGTDAMRELIKQAEIECPGPQRPRGKKGRVKKPKSRNLLEWLRDYEDDTPRFMDVAIVPFTTNLGENDIRMTKVQRQILGCFRSMDRARIFCRIHGYLSTCRKQGVRSSQSLELLFSGKKPEFLLKE